MNDTLSKFMPDAYKRVARVVGYCLLLGESADNWHGLTVVLTARLTTIERVTMAWAVLRSLTPEHVVAVVETVLPDSAGPPMVATSSYMDEAAFWADIAAPEEIEAYCFTTFSAMPEHRKAAFLAYVKGRNAA